MSDVKPLALDGGGPGRRAALSGPRGAEEADMLLGELSKELHSDGGLRDVVAKESVPADAVSLEGSVDALSVSLGSCAGTTGGLSCRGSSIVPNSATSLYLHCQKGIWAAKFADAEWAVRLSRFEGGSRKNWVVARAI